MQHPSYSDCGEDDLEPPTDPVREAPALSVAPANESEAVPTLIPELGETSSQTQVEIPSPPRSAKPHKPGQERVSSMRTLLQVLVIFLSLFMLVRTVFVEPFGVPTGSMAPTLYGNHREAPCPRCGAPLCVGSPKNPQRVNHVVPRNPQKDAFCFNCGLRGIDLTELTGEIAGDRLLVDKSAFQERGPRRWEVAVFFCPVDETDETDEPEDRKKPKPYVKRTVGLPGERIRLFDGDVYANDELQRKNMDQIRDTRIPIFIMNYAPKGGWVNRWKVESPMPDTLPATPPPETKLPNLEEVLKGNELHLDATGSTPAIGLTYKQFNLDTKELEVLKDQLAYNGVQSNYTPQVVHDFILDCELEVLAGNGVFACRLGDGEDIVRADLPIQAVPNAATSLVVTRFGTKESVSKHGFALTPGKKYKLEFAFVDRRVLLSVDGKDDLLLPLDLPAVLRERQGVTKPLQLGVRGASVVVRNIKLYRDIHYQARTSTNNKEIVYQLGADEYFMLGDNSSNSSDSRYWEVKHEGTSHAIPKPGVPRKSFIGKPFLIHQPLKAGRVSLNGKDWNIQTVDWDRLRLLN